MNNAKKYGLYQSNSFEQNQDDDIADLANYPQDSYIRPDQANKNVGKLDEYNKEKKFKQQKARVILNESKIAGDYSEQTNKIDDLIPADIGNAIDNVFSKVDNLLNATGKMLFGGLSSPKKNVVKKTQPQIQPRPVITNPQNNVVKQNTVINPVQNVVQPVKQQIVNNQPQQVNKVQTQSVPQSQEIKSSIVKKTKIEVDNSPRVSRGTYISELDLPIEILNDPDIVKYFDQMKLYEKKVSGGLCSKTFEEAEEILKRGRWGKLFMISFDKLKINTMMSSPEAGLQRFIGMSPVYKALGRNFSNTEELKKAIENDINTYLKTGEGSKDFHKFTYKLSRK